MRKILAGLPFATMLIAGPAAAEATVYQCTQAGLTRTVEVMRDDNAQPACEVWYAKPQESTTRQRLWSADRDASYCAQQAEGFIAKLSGMGWQCAPVEAALVEAPEQPAEQSEQPEPTTGE